MSGSYLLPAPFPVVFGSRGCGCCVGGARWSRHPPRPCSGHQRGKPTLVYLRFSTAQADRCPGPDTPPLCVSSPSTLLSFQGPLALASPPWAPRHCRGLGSTPSHKVRKLALPGLLESQPCGYPMGSLVLRWWGLFPLGPHRSLLLHGLVSLFSLLRGSLPASCWGQSFGFLSSLLRSTRPGLGVWQRGQGASHSTCPEQWKDDQTFHSLWSAIFPAPPGSYYTNSILCHSSLFCAWPRRRRRKEKEKFKNHAIYCKNKQQFITRENKTCAWILRIISSTSKNFLDCSSFGSVPQMPQITYSFIRDLLVKKFELCWLHPFNHFLVVSLVGFFFFL